MERQKRKEHLIIIGVMYVVGAILYGVLSYSSREVLGIKTWYCLIYAFLGGMLIAGLITGILLFIGWIKNRSIWIKVLLGIFFPFTIMGICYAGIVGVIPYVIYNIVQCRTSANGKAIEA